MLWLSWPSCILLVVLLMTSSAQPKIVSTDVGSLVFKRWQNYCAVYGNLMSVYTMCTMYTGCFCQACCAYLWVCRPLDGFSYRGSNPPCLPSRGPTWLIWEQTWPIFFLWMWKYIRTCWRYLDVRFKNLRFLWSSGLESFRFVHTFRGGYFSATAAALEPREWVDLSVEFLSPLTHFLVRPPLVLILIRVIFMKILALFTCSYESYIILHSRIASCVLPLGKL